MDFTYDDEQEALRDAVRGLVGKTYSDYEHRRQTVNDDPGFDEKQWSRMAEMGILGLPFAESDGGVGAGPVEIGIVAQEMGRVIAPEPFLTCVVLAGGLISALGTDEQRQAHLPAVTEGEKILALAHDEPGSRWAPSAKAVTATQDGDAWRLSGVKEPVVQGARADVLVVTALLPDGGTGVFLVEGDAEGLERTSYRTYDGGRAAKVALSSTPAAPLGEAVDRESAIGTILDIGRITAANEALGSMQTAMTMTTEYLKSRKQFGVTLNTFQALTFRAADMYVSLELASSMVQWATMVLLSGDPGKAADAARRASLQVSRAARHIGQESIQLHGGIGVTAEYAVGNHVARLTVLDHLLGDGTHHLGALAGAITDYEGIDPLA